MAAEVELTFTETTNDSIYITLVIYRKNDSQRIRRRTTLKPIPNRLKYALKQWKTSFNFLLNPYFLEEDEEAEEEFSGNCWQSYQQLIKEFNQWLSQDLGWQKIEQWFRDYVERSQLEIHLFIQTENPILQQLPWSDWYFIQKYYPQTEIALSSSEYELPRKWKGIKTASKVRILVVLGDDSHLDLELDKNLIQEIKPYGATIKVLEQESFETIKKALENEQGWHIFFYAGHSETLGNGSSLLWLNNHEEPITIEQLEISFKIAIEKGLHLGFFNSCDGLGIANYLTLLRFPQLIIMREFVPNHIAVSFLEYFLSFYCRNYSLIFSIHEAKNKLFKKYNNPDYYPGVHHLPILYSNPALPIPKWKDYLYQNSWSLKKIISISLLFLLSSSLPLSLWLESQDLEQVFFYHKLYPHITTFPMVVFWAFVWCLWQAFEQLINKKNLFKSVFFLIIISWMVLRIELTAPNMLLFEFNNQAQTTINNLSKSTLIQFQALPNNLVDHEKNIKTNHLTITKKDLENSLKRFLTSKKSQFSLQEQQAYFEYMTLGLDFEKTWSQAKNWQSSSRFFYGLIVFLTAFFILIMIVLWTKLTQPEQINNYLNYVGYLSFAQLLLFLWMPFRIYYSLSIKPLIFGEANLVGNLDFIVYTLMGSLLIISVTILFRLKKYLLALIIFLGLLGIILLSIEPMNSIIDYSFGLNTLYEPIWILYPIAMFIILWAWSQILEDWNP